MLIKQQQQMKAPVLKKQRLPPGNSPKPPVKRLVQKNTGLRKLSPVEVDAFLSTPLSTAIDIIEKEEKNDPNIEKLSIADKESIPDNLTMEDWAESLVLYIIVDGDDTRFNDPTDKDQRDMFNKLVSNFQKNKTEVMNEYQPLFKKIVDEQLDSFMQFARCIEVFKIGMSKASTTSKPLLREQMEEARYVAKIENDQQRQEAVQQFDSKWKWDLAKRAGMIFLTAAAFTILGQYGSIFGRVIMGNILDPALEYVGSFLPSFASTIAAETTPPTTSPSAPPTTSPSTPPTTPPSTPPTTPSISPSNNKSFIDRVLWGNSTSDSRTSNSSSTNPPAFIKVQPLYNGPIEWY